MNSPERGCGLCKWHAADRRFERISTSSDDVSGVAVLARFTALYPNPSLRIYPVVRVPLTYP